MSDKYRPDSMKDYYSREQEYFKSFPFIPPPLECYLAIREEDKISKQSLFGLKRKCKELIECIYRLEKHSQKVKDALTEEEARKIWNELTGLKWTLMGSCKRLEILKGANK